MRPGELTAFQPDIWQCCRTTIGGRGRFRWNWRKLSYPFWRVYWNEELGAWVSFDGEDFPLDPESVVVVGPNAAIDHHLRGTVTHNYMHVTLGYPYDSVTPRVDRIPTRALPMHLLERALTGHSGPREPQRLDFSQALAAHAFACSVLCALPKEIWPRPAANPVIRNLVEEISRHPERVYRTSAMAEGCGMSVNTLLRRFRNQIGRSPQQFVTESRLQKACVMLDQTGQSIEQIAEASGFCDRYHFTKVFKVHYRCGPAAFRRTHSRRPPAPHA